MDKVFSFEQASDWFATHTGDKPGNITCVKLAEDGVTHQGHAVCETLEDARKFYGVEAPAAPEAAAEAPADDGLQVTNSAPEPPAEEAAASPVADMTAHDAIDHIGRMRSTDKLQEIVDSETRSTVVEAAKARIEALNPADKPAA